MLCVVARLSRPAAILSRPSSGAAAGTPTGSASTTGVDVSQDFEFEDFVDDIGTSVAASNKGLSFAKMLRQSKLVQLGDISGRVAVGKIMHRMADDLYIDVGLKFNAVCKAPPVNGEHYTVGADVLVRLHDYELSERFLGSKRDLTLLEADATLLRLLRGRRTQKRSDSGAKQNEEKMKIADV